MKENFTALKSGDWEEYKGIFRIEVKATEWTFDRIKEASEQVVQDEAEKLSIVQEILIRSTDYVRRIIAPGKRQGGVTMSYLCPNCNSFPLEDYIWWVSGRKKHTTWWFKHDGSSPPNRLLVVQTGESIDLAKVFKAHAVPQGLCANLINALKLQTNQQENGDGLIQNIVTNLDKGSTKGLTEGLREFTKIGNERALEVGYLNRGTGTFKVRKPKVPEGCSVVTVRENSDELTLRAEEVGTLKTNINVNHIEKEK